MPTAPPSPPTPAPSRAVLTWANALTFLRIVVLIPAMWCLWTGLDRIALILLVVSGLSDYFDGVVARKLGQTSELGHILDPIADKLTLVGIVLAFGLRGMMPWWFLGIVVLREIVVAVAASVVRRRGYRSFRVNFVGKAGTFGLLAALPLLVVAHLMPHAPQWAAAAWALAAWGTFFSYVSAWVYGQQAWTIHQRHKTAP